MNLALYLTPTPHLVCLDSRLPVREALERLEQTTFTAVPVIDADRCYLGTLTEGDLLRFLRSGADLDETRLLDVPIRSENRAVPVVATIDAVVELAMDQNFVPVVDSRGVLMGIVTRKTILRAATSADRARGAPMTPAEPRAFTRTDLDALRAEGRLPVLLDVRSADEFARGTVDGARHAPPEVLEALVPTLRDAVVVTVCNHGGPRSQGAAARLRELGVSAGHLVGGVHGG